MVDELEELLYALTFGEDIDPITDPVVEKYVKGRISELKTEEEK